MKAVGYRQPSPIDHPEALIALDVAIPDPRPRDLRVRVRAISVNPVDVKLRAGAAPAAGQPRILGFDAAGVVEAVGSEASLFRPGDEVFYAGAIDRPGTNAELHVVDERIVAAKPRSLSPWSPPRRGPRPGRGASSSARTTSSITASLAPQGRIALIDDPKTLDANLLKRKSASLHWELMFTRSLFETDDMIAQHRLLTEVARLVDAGRVKTTLTEHLGPLSVETLRHAHRLVESGRVRGKLVLDAI